MNIVFGGAFNPPTIAHLNMIKEINRLFKPEKVILLPTGNKYPKANLIPFNDRVKMLETFKDCVFNLEISKLEENDSFKGTINSLENLSKNNFNLVLLIGADQFEVFDKWIRYEEILQNYQLIVCSRPNYSIDESKFLKYKDKITFVTLDFDISSTKVRKNVNKNKELLTKEVYEYIVENSLYKKGDQNV